MKPNELKKILLRAGAMTALAFLCLQASVPVATAGAHARPVSRGYTPGSPQRTIELSGSTFTLYPWSSQSFDLGGTFYVHKIILQAEGATRDGGAFDVVVNGNRQGPLYVPGRDPVFTLNVAAFTNSISLEHVSGDRIWIQSIKVEVSPARSTPGLPGYSALEPATEVAQLARAAISLTEALEPFATEAEYATYLLPIKKAAGIAYAVVNARGELSGKSREAITALIAQIDFAETYLKASFEREAAFDWAVELLSVRERLDQLLR